MLVVLGNACADVTCYMSQMPRPGETVLALQMHEDIGGKGINQAVAARRTGAQVHLVAAIGNDATAAAIRNILSLEGLSEDGLIAIGPFSDRSVIMVDSCGENSIVSFAALAQNMLWEQAQGRVALAANDSLLLQGNLSAHVSAAAIARAKSVGARVIVNAAPMQPWLAGNAGSIDLLVVNHLEACQWASLPQTATADCVISYLGMPRTCITLGGGGCLVRDGERCTRITAPRVDVVDTTGAGDVFTGTLAAEWSCGATVENAARLAVLAASDKVQRRGTISVFPTSAMLYSLRTHSGREHLGQ